MQRYLAQDAANVWLFNSQVSAVARKGLQGLWMNYPIFTHDIASLRWAS
jgi:peptide/nickel transport system substrate-binding protein